MRSETQPSQDKEKNEQEPLLPPIQPVIDFGSVVIKNSRAAIHCLTIAGQIEGHMLLPNTQKATKYEHVLPLLAYLEESDEIDGVLFLLNTVGGDVEAGLAIAELISGMKKPTVSLVLGGGHSIGVPLAVAPMVTMIAPSASRAHKRDDHRGAADLPVFRAPAGAHRALCDKAFRHQPGEISDADDGYAGLGLRCWQRALRGGGGRLRACRAARQSVRRAGGAVCAHRRKKEKQVRKRRLRASFYALFIESP